MKQRKAKKGKEGEKAEVSSCGGFIVTMHFQ